jgi:hypothetical protein
LRRTDAAGEVTNRQNQFNARFNTVISVDTSGMLEYWVPEEPFDLPKNVNFEYKAETDLYDFKKVGMNHCRIYATISLLLTVGDVGQISANVHCSFQRWLKICHNEYAR